MKGIDISAWQENIDWQAVKDAGAEFAIVKLGQNGRLDPMFVTHVNNAVAYGLKFGVYYYSTATIPEEAQMEADWVAAQLQTYLNGSTPDMGVWYDMEDDSIAQSGANITALCVAFVNRLLTAGFTCVGVYSSYNWLTNGYIFPDQLGNVPIWCAQYNRECNYEGPNLVMWQFTDAWNIAEMNFDGNICLV